MCVIPAFSFLVLLSALPLAAQGIARPELRFAPHTLELSDGKKVEAEMGRLRVPERRGASDGRDIELAVVRLRSTSAQPGRPILFLGGSPGGASSIQTMSFAPLFPFFQALREAGDVIVFDYRGSGLSSPRLRCPPTKEFPADLFASREKALPFFVEQSAACARALREGGADLRGYTWAEVASDVEDIRRALGVEKLDLVGFSSGTHAALATLRRHESGIGRVVMTGVEGPNDTRKLPSAVDRQLAQIGRLVAADSALGAKIPDFVGLVRSVLDRLEREPAVIEIENPAGGARVRGTVGRFALEFMTAKSLSGPDEFDALPRLYYSLSQGDLRPLARAMQRLASRGAVNPLSYILDGASGVTAERWARIEQEAPASPLRNAVNFPFPEINDAWGVEDLGPSFREPVRSATPALFVTGELDGNTPPPQAKDVRRGFANGTHLVIGNGGHDALFRSSAAATAVVEFLRGRDVSATRVTLPVPRFSPLAR